MRAFIAAEIPDDIKTKLRELQLRFNMDGLTPVRTEAMHLTLQFFEEVSDEQVVEIERAMDNSRTKRFKVSVAGISYFSPSFVKVIYASIKAGSSEIAALYRDLVANLKANGIMLTEEREYTPHLTLFRVKHQPDKAMLVQTIKKYENSDVGSFSVDRLLLIKSVLSSEGPEYTTLHVTEFD